MMSLEGVKNLRFFQIIKKLIKGKLALVGLVFCVGIILIAVFAPWLHPYDPSMINVEAMFQPPSPAHPLGTDELGRDVLSRLIDGTRITILVGVLAVLIAMTAGIILGLISGFCGGKVDLIITSIMDAVWSFPTIILALALTAALGVGLDKVLIAIGIVFTPGFTRIIRGMVLSIRESEYVQSAKVIGLNNYEIMKRYILPNVFSVVIVQGSLNAAQAIITEASLSFLGLGLQPPAASWGSMLKTGYPYLAQAPWLSIFPGVAILITVMSLNFLGDGLRDSLDVRIRTD